MLRVSAKRSLPTPTAAAGVSGLLWRAALAPVQPPWTGFCHAHLHETFAGCSHLRAVMRKETSVARRGDGQQSLGHFLHQGSNRKD
jgi:hypothetical protein